MNRREALLATMAATLRPFNPSSVSYAGACEVAAASRLLFVSGQVPERPDGSVRREVLKDRTPALTIIIADIYDEAWLLEIEAIAAA